MGGFQGHSFQLLLGDTPASLVIQIFHSHGNERWYEKGDSLRGRARLRECEAAGGARVELARILYCNSSS